jgi:hypothetical protein
MDENDGYLCATMDENDGYLCTTMDEKMTRRDQYW